MGKTAGSGGLLVKPPTPMTFAGWQKGMCDEWFASNTAFVTHIVQQPLIMPETLDDNVTVRAIAVFLRYGVANSVSKCNKCGGKVRLEMRTSRGWTTYGWTCCASGHKHMEEQVNVHGFLVHIPINSWMPFLHYINLLRLGRNNAEANQELTAGYGNMSRHTFTAWRSLYQQALGKALPELDAVQVGGRNEVVVMDETVVGVHAKDGWSLNTKGIGKRGATARRASRRTTKSLVLKGHLKRLPARTIGRGEQAQSKSCNLRKKPAAATVVKKPAGHVFKKPAAQRNLKNNGRWLWLAIAVGKGKTVYTHANKLKRVSYRLLPCASDAQHRKPRGFAELSDTIVERVRKGSFLVYDGWKSTEAAVQANGYKHAPPVIHEGMYRDATTGFHTNDAESENFRVKRWSRHRYGRLSLTVDDMDEYVFYTNVGEGVAAVMKGLAMSSGMVVTNAFL